MKFIVTNITKIHNEVLIKFKKDSKLNVIDRNRKKLGNSKSN